MAFWGRKAETKSSDFGASSGFRAENYSNLDNYSSAFNFDNYSAAPNPQPSEGKIKSVQSIAEILNSCPQFSRFLCVMK